MSEIVHDPPWVNGPDEPEECESHPGEAKPCRFCRDEENERRAETEREDAAVWDAEREMGIDPSLEDVGDK